MKRDAKLTDPNVLASIACLAGFWYFLNRGTRERGKDTPRILRPIQWW